MKLISYTIRALSQISEDLPRSYDPKYIPRLLLLCLEMFIDDEDMHHEPIRVHRGDVFQGSGLGLSHHPKDAFHEKYEAV
jgi:hypothetical protein